MPLIDRPNHTLSPFLPGSGGPSTGFIDNIEAAYLDQSRNESLYGLESLAAEEYFANQKRKEALTGEKLTTWFMPVFRDAIRTEEGLDVERGLTEFQQWTDSKLGIERGPTEQQQRWNDFLVQEERIKELKRTHPQILTFSEIWKNVRKRAQQIERDAADIEGRASFSGAVGSFIGRAGGAFTWRDPLNITGLGLGGFGPSVGVRLATEVGFGAAIEAGDQFLGVQDNRKLAHLEERDPWTSIMFAGAGAGAFRGVFEGAAPAWRAVESRVAPQRAAARIVSKEIERAAKSTSIDERITQFLQQKKQTPRVRAALHALEEGQYFLRNNPFGHGRDAAHSHQTKMQEALDILYQKVGADTAVGRFLPSQAIPDLMPHASGEWGQSVARRHFPSVFENLDNAQARLVEAESRVRALEQSQATRQQSDTVAHVDGQTSERLRLIEAEIKKPIPRARRHALEQEYETILEHFPMGSLESDLRIGLKHRIRSAEKGRRAARRDVKRAQKAAEQATQKALLREKTLAQISNPLPKPQRSNTFYERYSPPLTRESAEALIQTTKDSVSQQDAVGKALLQKTEDETRLSDIGLETDIPDDFTLLIDGDGQVGGRAVTIQQLMEELRRDESLVQQMGVCAI